MLQGLDGLPDQEFAQHVKTELPDDPDELDKLIKDSCAYRSRTCNVGS